MTGVRVEHDTRRVEHLGEQILPRVQVVSVAHEPPSGWDERTVGAVGGHVMQGSAWAAHRRAQGAEPRFVTFDDGRACMVVMRDSPLVPGTTATVRRGPAHAGDGPGSVAARAAALVAWLRGEGARDLIMDPELESDARYDMAMDRLGFGVTAEFQPSIHVMRLDFPTDATEASVMAGFSKSARQRIRGAEKAGITVTPDPKGDRLDGFGELLVERADDLGITIRPDLGYVAAWRRLLAAGHARLMVAEHQGEMLGGLLVYVQGGILSTAYSADRVQRRRELAGTMHLVRWTVIRDALEAGSRAVELGGVDLPGHRNPPRVDEPNHGMYEHKASFGAHWVVRTPARRIVLRPWSDRYATARRAILVRARTALPGR